MDRQSRGGFAPCFCMYHPFTLISLSVFIDVCMHSSFLQRWICPMFLYVHVPSVYTHITACVEMCVCTAVFSRGGFAPCFMYHPFTLTSLSVFIHVCMHSSFLQRWICPLFLYVHVPSVYTHITVCIYRCVYAQQFSPEVDLPPVSVYTCTIRLRSYHCLY